MQIKKEFNNGMFDCMEIYHSMYKLREKTNRTLWNATNENPIRIAKVRLTDYEVSDVLLDREENAKI